AAARARGLATVDGLGMLIHQGARAFEIWFGVRPDVRGARLLLERALVGEA
ncbi:MAG: shikimate dehydrogenase, partial [Alphaproteobacteria bacterium]|nr:shikimate dehydrogenase [Alphaproteobacteria bacterium]